MRSSTPKPKPVKKKIKKNVKRRPLKVPQHALERLPNDYIVVRGSGGGLGRPPRPRGLVGAPAPGPASLDPAGYPINNGTPGLPTREFFDFLGTGLRSASGVFVNAANLFMNLGHQVQQQYGQQNRQLPPPSQPASSLGTDTDYQSDYGTIFTDPDDFDDDTPDAPVDIEAPALAPAQEPAPAPAPAPAALPGREFQGTDITDRIATEEELYRLREQVDQLRVQLAGRPTPERMNELQDRVAGLQQQLIDAQQMIDTREGPGDQTNVQELRDRIAYLDDSLTTAMQTVAVVTMAPIDGQPGEGGQGGGGDVNQTRRIQQLEDLARELTDEINRSQDRIRELQYELDGRPTRERFQQTAQQVQQLVNALTQENEHILRMETEFASLQAQLDEARQRPETASIGVGTDTAQLTEAEVNTETPQMIDQMTSTYGRRQDMMARRRTVVSPVQNQNTPSMRDERDATNQPTPQRRRPNESGRPRDPDNGVSERPAVVRRLFRDPPANTNNLALDVATAGAVARQEEFVPAVPEIQPVIEQPPQHNHAPAQPRRTSNRPVRLTRTYAAALEEGSVPDIRGARRAGRGRGRGGGN